MTLLISFVMEQKEEIKMKGDCLMEMTAAEVCELLGVSISTLTQKFQRTKKSAKNCGYIIEKKGRGKSAMYDVRICKEYQENTEKVFDEQKKGISVEKSWVGIGRYEFNILIYLLLNADKTFRGTYTRLLNYMDIKNDSRNREQLKKGIEGLVSKKICYSFVDEDVVVIILRRQAEINGLLFDSEMAKISNEIAKTVKTNWTNVVKVWLACRIIVAENSTLTNQLLSQITGLSAKTCDKCLKGLISEDILRTKKVYIRDLDKQFVQCLGKSVEMNGFYN